MSAHSRDVYAAISALRTTVLCLLDAETATVAGQIAQLRAVVQTFEYLRTSANEQQALAFLPDFLARSRNGGVSIPALQDADHVIIAGWEQGLADAAAWIEKNYRQAVDSGRSMAFALDFYGSVARHVERLLAMHPTLPVTYLQVFPSRRQARRAGEESEHLMFSYTDAREPAFALLSGQQIRQVVAIAEAEPAGRA